MESNLKRGYLEAFDAAREKLLAKDKHTVADCSGAALSAAEDAFIIPYLGEQYRVRLDSGKVLNSSGAAAAVSAGVLILHYLNNAAIREPAGRLISFREVRGGGSNYYAAFERRAVLPLLKTFDKKPGALTKAGFSLGGEKADIGDESVTVPVLPLVPVTYALWRGDDEMPSAASILFDESVNSFLSCEDAAAAASFGTYELIRRSNV